MIVNSAATAIAIADAQKNTAPRGWFQYTERDD